MKPLKLTQKQIRRLAVRCQLLHRRNTVEISDAGQLIKQLGYIQLDTIHVVQRTHHHTFWTRLPRYRPELLDSMLADDRQVFEFWGHAMSYLPIEDYRFYLHHMEKALDPNSKWEKERLANFGHLMEPVLERIQTDGPLGVKDFPAPEKKIVSRWGGRKPEKVALEMLLWRGDIMVTRREKFHRIYDLTERVLPADINTAKPSAMELGRFLVRRALQAYGAATEREIENHIMNNQRQEIQLAIKDMIKKKEIVEINSEGDDKVNYALTDTIEHELDQPVSSESISFLSPFDNLIIQRERTRRLFNFEYSLECYTPAAKRRWGYFVFLILAGDRLVGRFDPKADRKNRILLIQSLQFEPWVKDFDALLSTIRRKFQDMAIFNDCDSYEMVIPDACGTKI